MIQGMEGADKSLLSHIVGLVSVAQEQIGQAKDGLLVLANKRFPGHLVPLAGLNYQVRFNQVSLSGEGVCKT
jgi:hypothetical protein